MNSIYRKGSVLIIPLVIICLIYSGCYTRRIAFTSDPPAVVTVGSQKCITPCTLDIPNDYTAANFEIAGGQKKTVPLPEMPSMWTNTKRSGFMVGGESSWYIGVLFVILGIGIIISELEAADDEPSSPSSVIDQNEDKDVDSAVIGIGLASIGTGVLIYTAAASLEGAEEGFVQRLDVEFPDQRSPIVPEKTQPTDKIEH